MESCIRTILDINQYLGDGQIRPEIIRQFENLQFVVRAFSEESVEEDEIGRIEEATNRLLEQIRDSMEMQGISFSCLQAVH